MSGSIPGGHGLSTRVTLKARRVSASPQELARMGKKRKRRKKKRVEDREQ